MDDTERTFSLKNILISLFVTVLGTVIAAYIIQEGRFAPAAPTAPPQTALNAIIESNATDAGSDPVAVSLYSPTPLESPLAAGGGIGTLEPPTSSPQQTIAEGTIGYSVLGRSIDFIRIGNGPRIIVIAGALHGIEPNASDLVDYLRANFSSMAASIEDNFTFYILPRLNPDGLVSGSRYNANGVDLNRNWATNNWSQNAVGPSGTVPGSGGSSPFSEPETLAFSNFLLGLRERSSQPIIVFIYHSAYPKTGLVQPSYRLENGNLVSDPNAYQIAEAFAATLGYKFSSVWTGYEITGEAIHWCGDQGIICMDIELPSAKNLTDTEKQNHLLAVMNVIP